MSSLLGGVASSLLYGLSLIDFAEAKLPWQPILTPTLPPSDSSVTFDPLGVAAILNNPRAYASASRLYTQRDADIFRWPHTSMVGGALPPVSTLVNHLSSRATSIHPALSLALTNAEKLRVSSDTVFSELPINFSNLWLTDVLAFPSSSQPQHDLLIVELENVFGVPVESVRIWPERLLLFSVGLVNGVLVVAGVILSVFAGDMWSAALFFTYVCHWIASTLVSVHPLITHHHPDKPICRDDTIKHALYKRPEGGAIIFKGRQDVIEKWARTTWKFSRTWRNCILHWNWMITGFFAALASVVCMVNMAGYLQLGFLAVLVYSSLAEIIATQVARSLLAKARFHGHTDIVCENETWTQAIIRATLCVSEPCRVDELDWIKLGLLPDFQTFRNMQAMLSLSGRETDFSKFEAEIDAVMMENTTKRPDLAVRIAQEIRGALREREERDNSKTKDKVSLRRWRNCWVV